MSLGYLWGLGSLSNAGYLRGLGSFGWLGYLSF